VDSKPPLRAVIKDDLKLEIYIRHIPQNGLQLILIETLQREKIVKDIQ